MMILARRAFKFACNEQGLNGWPRPTAIIKVENLQRHLQQEMSPAL